MAQEVGIYGSRDDLVRLLRDRCPQWSFVTNPASRDAARVAIVDERDALDRGPRKSVVRIILHDEHPPAQRKQGELRLRRDLFLNAPEEFLGFAFDLAAAAIHAAQLETSVTQMNQIHELMTLVDADTVSERITQTALSILGLSRGTLFLHDPRQERYVVSYSSDTGFHETKEFLPGVPPALLQNALTSPQHLAVERTPNGNGLLIMPLQAQDDIIAVIRVPLSKEERFSDEAAAHVSRYLSAVAQVLSNVYQLTRSRDLAMRDDLTKAFNRRFFESYLDEEIERARRYGTLFSIIFLDLDDLKMVNSFYGHLTGSRTLQEVAKRILTAVRAIDKVVRFGGDEFCIILPQTDQGQALAVAKRVRKAMTATPFRVDESIEISITASFGIATFPTHALSKEDLVRQADTAMYKVKSTTKNAVGVATVENAAIKPVSLP